MATNDFSFTKVFVYDGSSYTDRTLEAMSPAGTSFSILGGTNHFVYLGHDFKFDMAVFDMDTVASIGTPKWEYYNGSAWTEFIPSSGTFAIDPDDSEGSQFSFDEDGAETINALTLDSGVCIFLYSDGQLDVRFAKKDNPHHKKVPDSGLQGVVLRQEEGRVIAIRGEQLIAVQLG